MVFLQDSTPVVGEVVQTSASKLGTEAVLPVEEAGGDAACAAGPRG